MITLIIAAVVNVLVLLAQHFHLHARLNDIMAAHGVTQDQLATARDEINTLAALLTPAIAQLPKTRAKRAAAN